MKRIAWIGAFIFVAVVVIYVLGNRQESTGKIEVHRSADMGPSAVATPMPASSGVEMSKAISPEVVSMAAQAGLSAAAMANAKNEMERAQEQYEYDLGITLPEKYRAIHDTAKLRQLMAQGDRFAATRLGQVLLEAGDFDGTIDAYRKAAELGSVAPLTDIAMLLEPQENSARAYVQQMFGRMPSPDLQQAYSAAYTAYLRGYGESLHVFDRIARQVPAQQQREYQGRAAMEHMRLLELYRQRYGRYPSVSVSATEQMLSISAFQSNYAPRVVVNQGGKP